ncbi:nucleotidyltransferase family protein, partial [Candidatus Hydrogenedentota bacterium]
SKNDVKRLIAETSPVLRSLGVKRIGLFGSFVDEKQTPESDIDLLVHFEPGMKTFDNFVEVSFLLEDRLMRRVELLTLESLSPHIGPKILGTVEYVELPA